MVIEIESVSVVVYRFGHSVYVSSLAIFKKVSLSLGGLIPQAIRTVANKFFNRDRSSLF